jgi:hypothetical protein
MLVKSASGWRDNSKVEVAGDLQKPLRHELGIAWMTEEDAEGKRLGLALPPAKPKKRLHRIMEEKTERSWRLSSATNTHAHVMGFKKKSEGLVFEPKSGS